MYLRLTRGRFDPVIADRITALADDVSAAVRQLPGLHQLYQARDLTTGTIVAISLWDSEAHARFSRDQLGDVVTRLQDAGVRLEEPEIYEVVQAGR